MLGRCGQPGDGCPRRWLILVGLLLAASLAANAAMMVRYRVPHRLWESPTPLPDLPEIELSLGEVPGDEPPLLAAPATVESRQELRDWQSLGRKKLQELLGIIAPNQVPAVREVGRAEVGTVVRRSLVFTQDDGMEVPAFLLHAQHGEPRPGLLVIPGHSMGIVATSGIVSDYQNAMALELAKAGYVVLTMEVRGFGYLQKLGPGPEPMDHGPYTGYLLVRGTTRLGVTIRDAMMGLSYLEAHPEVMPQRLGVVGFSSGCDASIYIGALDERVDAVVASGCVGSHESNFRLSRNDSYEAVPGLARWLEMSDCLGLLSPRPVLVHWGEKDNDPRTRSAAFNPTSLHIFEAARRIYALEDKGDRLEQHITPGLEHAFDVDAAIAFVHQRLPLAESANKHLEQ